MAHTTDKTLLWAALLLAAPAWGQVYKCPDVSGRTVIQQLPCAGGKTMDVKPASGKSAGRAALQPEPGASAAKPMTEAQRLNALSDQSARERRRRDLEEVFVPRARAATYAHRDECKRRQDTLRAGQYEYRQNLYGKTHAAQVAAEVAAVSAQCDTRDRELVADHLRILNECQGLGGCKDMRP